MVDTGGGKLPGKTQYSGRRRTTTRRSGFKSHPDATGGEYRIETVDTMILPSGCKFALTFHLPKTRPCQWIGYGGWFCVEGDVEINLTGGPTKRTFKQFPLWLRWQKQTAFLDMPLDGENSRRGRRGRREGGFPCDPCVLGVRPVLAGVSRQVPSVLFRGRIPPDGFHFSIRGCRFTGLPSTSAIDLCKRASTGRRLDSLADRPARVRLHRRRNRVGTIEERNPYLLSLRARFT